MGGVQDHAVFGGVFSLFVYAVTRHVFSFSVEAVAASIAFILLAAVFPDIDHRGSVIHRTVKYFLVVTAAGTVAVVAAPVWWAVLVSMVCTGLGVTLLFSAVKPRHRGVTHSLSAAVVFSVAVAAATLFLFETWIPAVFAFTAYVSHLVLDGTLFKPRR